MGVYVLTGAQEEEVLRNEMYAASLTLGKLMNIFQLQAPLTEKDLSEQAEKIIQELIALRGKK